MSDYDIGRLAYLGLLAAVLVVWFFVHNRDSLTKKTQQAAAWGLIFMGTIAAVGLWDDIRTTVRPSLATVTGAGQIEVPRARDGHYYLTLNINGQAIEFLVDTGATDMVMTPADAARVGIDLDDLAFTSTAMTANGRVRTARISLNDVSVGPIRDRNVTAWVNDGDMDQSLLGMAYLQRWDKIEITGGALVLTR